MTEYRARLFVLASGQCWSPHLLLLSANSRFPNGIANRSGLVGRYMNGHKFISAQATIDERDVPRPEHDAQPDLARVLPLRAEPAVRPSRHARVGKLRRQGAAAALGRRPAAARRRAARRLALARAQGQLGAPARLLRLASVGRQPADARSRRRRTATAIRCRRSIGSSMPRPRRAKARRSRIAPRCSSAWPRRATAA